MTTTIDKRRLKQIKKAYQDGLAIFARPEPQTLSEWAENNFYLSSESSYIEGRWETLPFQLAIMNAIGHPDIEQVNFIKSARVGYTQMIRAAVGYFLEHKKRNQILYQPVDAQAANFMKSHVETMIRDVPVVKKLAPWCGSKHRDSTLDTKKFNNGKQLWVFGGKSAKNYREKSADCVYYDELAAFDDDIEKEGSPTFLGDKRLEGSAFPKSIRGSTPKDAGNCQITKAAEESKHLLKFHLPCPNCEQEQVLKWGGKDVEYGIKWEDDDPKTAHYVCEHCSTQIDNNSLESMQLEGVWRCEETGINTTDGISYYNVDGEKIDAPESISFHIWSAYSLFSTWSKIVSDFQKCKKDRSKLKTFVNTTLGEVWEEDEAEKIEHQNIYARREHYPAQCPLDSGIITCAVDTQDDRFEIEHVLWVEGEESYRLSYERLYGDLSRSEIWDVLKKRVERKFITPSGLELSFRICFIDSGGHYTDEVYKFSRKNGVRRYVPIKGYNVMGKPVISWPRKRNDKSVYLVMVGTDTAKEIIADRLKQMEPGEGYMHYPISDDFDENYFIHLTNERRRLKVLGGKRQYVWENNGRRNEPFDTSVYNLAAVRALQQHFGIKLPKKHLANIQIEENATEKPAKAENKQKSKPINKKPVKLRKSRRKPRYDDGDDWI
jgi:phage terminase large subunit GpA-like protein